MLICFPFSEIFQICHRFLWVVGDFGRFMLVVACYVLITLLLLLINMQKWDRKMS